VATYQFSALAGGQAVSFSLNSEVNNFEQAVFATGDVVAI